MLLTNRILLLPVLMLFFSAAIAQSNVTKLTKSTIPRSAKYRGVFLDAIQWKDSLGDNIVIRSETGIYQTKADIDSGTNSAEVMAYRYVLKNDSAVLSWKVTDFVKECELDITANFIEHALLITDLNKDSIAEVWLVYQTACRGDVSPATMKIIMYEGKKKYAMKGRRKIQISKKEVIGGEYSFDNAFLKGNLAFRDYAKKLWKRYLMDDPTFL